MNEFKALVEMINRSSLVGKVLLLADRGYESYNNIEHLNNIGWKYLIRVKAPDVHCGLLWKRELPLNLAFDKYITVLLTRRQTNEVKSQPKLYKRLSKYSKFDFLPLESREAYPFSYRIVSIELSSGKFEYLVTNLSQEEMSGEELKEIYHKR
ncbi:MAG: transposase [Firmicutes bacterium]|nr:transposase [Bacillota bacterium]